MPTGGFESRILQISRIFEDGELERIEMKIIDHGMHGIHGIFLIRG